MKCCVCVKVLAGTPPRAAAEGRWRPGQSRRRSLATAPAGRRGGSGVWRPRRRPSWPGVGTRSGGQSTPDSSFRFSDAWTQEVVHPSSTKTKIDSRYPSWYAPVRTRALRARASLRRLSRPNSLILAVRPFGWPIDASIPLNQTRFAWLLSMATTVQCHKLCILKTSN